jgi:hypothetical protein
MGVAAATAAATTTTRSWARSTRIRPQQWQRPFSSATAGFGSGGFDCDVLVCGAGVVGLAVARALARYGWKGGVSGWWKGNGNGLGWIRDQ